MTSFQTLCMLGLLGTSLACAVPLRGPAASGELGEASLAVTLSSSDYDNDWEPVENLDSLGLEGTWGADDGLAFEWGLDYGNERNTAVSRGIFLPTATRVEATHYRLSIGARQSWDLGGIYPYVGVGVEAARTELDIGGADDTDTSVGGYAHAGFRADLGSDASWFYGLDARYGGLGAEPEFSFGPVKADFDGNYKRLAATLGLRF